MQRLRGHEDPERHAPHAPLLPSGVQDRFITRSHAESTAPAQKRYVPANLEVRSSRTAPPLIYVKKLHAGAHNTRVAITLTLQMIIRASTPATDALT